MSTEQASVEQAVVDRALADAEMAAAKEGDPAARWRALEACRDYLRLVVRRGHWSQPSTQPATSDLIQGAMCFVRKNPGPGVLIAAAVGFLLGRLFGRR